MSNVFQFNFRQELKRKSFHLLGLVYPLTLHWIGLTDFRILLIVFWVVVVVFEGIRLRASPINDGLFEYFGFLFRDEERTRISGVFWMISGVLFATFALRQPILITAVLLYVVFGDLGASLVGKWARGPSWFGSTKRLSGSAACFVICVAIGMFLLRPEYSWTLILIGASAATAAEGIQPINDNFSIPVAASLVFLVI